MKLGLIGLGKMGYNLALNMKDKGIGVVAYNRSKESVDRIISEGVSGAYSLEELFNRLDERKIVWLMIPSGKAVDDMIGTILPFLKANDIVIDGGNSFYQDTIRRFNEMKKKGIHYIDAGTSGGTSGARYGACTMVGGEKEPVAELTPLFQAISVPDGYGYFGAPGAGHFVKMIHNGIEYGMMQAIGEGFDVLRASQFNIDYAQVAKVWNHGSIIESALMNDVQNAFKKDGNLDLIQGIVDDSGEGQWTIEEAFRLKVSIPVITSALFARYKSKDNLRFSEKVVAAMRNEFGGHAVYKK
jgi:6-phosphogluconate dehydrogenase